MLKVRFKYDLSTIKCETMLMIAQRFNNRPLLHRMKIVLSVKLDIFIINLKHWLYENLHFKTNSKHIHYL